MQLPLGKDINVTERTSEKRTLQQKTALSSQSGNQVDKYKRILATGETLHVFCSAEGPSCLTHNGVLRSMKQAFSCSYLSKSRCSTCQKQWSWHYVCWGAGCSEQRGFLWCEACNWNTMIQADILVGEDPIAALLLGISRATHLQTPTQTLLKPVMK